MMPHIEDIAATHTTDALADLLAEFCSTHSLPLISADELLLEVLEAIERAKSEAQWLQAFINRWEAVQADEDFEAAIAARGER